LSRRRITRARLNASVPVSLELAERIDIIRVTHRLESIPPADFVALGVDWFLRGCEPDRAVLGDPWSAYAGQGTRADLPYAEQALNKRFIEREPLRAQVPAELDLAHRVEMYRIVNRLRNVPAGDIVTVAMDRFLRLMDA
jgi:hypothetical protein